MAIFGKVIAWLMLAGALLYLVQAVLMLVNAFRRLWARLRGRRTSAQGPLWMDVFWPLASIANLFISGCFAILAAAAVIGP